MPRRLIKRWGTKAKFCITGALKFLRPGQLPQPRLSALRAALLSLAAQVRIDSSRLLVVRPLPARRYVENQRADGTFNVRHQQQKRHKDENNNRCLGTLVSCVGRVSVHGGGGSPSSRNVQKIRFTCIDKHSATISAPTRPRIAIVLKIYYHHVNTALLPCM